jgi:hypothetical protein
MSATFFFQIWSAEIGIEVPFRLLYRKTFTDETGTMANIGNLCRI